MAPSDRASSVLWASAAHWLVRSRLKRWRFARLLAHERHRAPRRSHNASAQTLANLHAAFQHASLWMGEADKCLARSIAFRKIGRAACRERVGRYGLISGVGGSLKKK